MMPPTCAADWNTYSGRSFSKKASTVLVSMRSYCACGVKTRLLYPRLRSAAVIALPTNPLLPATYILLSLFIIRNN